MYMNYVHNKIPKHKLHNLNKSKRKYCFCMCRYSVVTFFFRFPLSLCTAFISCTSLSTNVCWAANSDRITLTLLSPWREEEVCALKREGNKEWFSLLQNHYRQCYCNADVYQRGKKTLGDLCTLAFWWWVRWEDRHHSHVCVVHEAIASRRLA